MRRSLAGSAPGPTGSPKPLPTQGCAGKHLACSPGGVAWAVQPRKAGGAKHGAVRRRCPAGRAAGRAASRASALCERASACAAVPVGQGSAYTPWLHAVVASSCRHGPEMAVVRWNSAGTASTKSLSKCRLGPPAGAQAVAGYRDPTATSVGSAGPWGPRRTSMDQVLAETIILTSCGRWAQGQMGLLAALLCWGQS